MNEEQALNLLSQVIRQYRGTLDEHTALQEAFKIVSEKVKEEKK